MNSMQVNIPDTISKAIVAELRKGFPALFESLTEQGTLKKPEGFPPSSSTRDEHISKRESVDQSGGVHSSLRIKR